MNEYTYHISTLLINNGLRPYLYGHSPHFQKLVEYLLHAACKVGLVPELSGEVIGYLAMLSTFHDIGKYAISSDLLRKPDKLTAEELAVLRRHTTESSRLLEAVPSLQDDPGYHILSDICRHHHERWDGTGYPDGLPGEHIMSWVQVIGLADAYDALVTPRPYRAALSHRAAAKTVLHGGCGAFAPALLDCFRACAYAIPQVVYGEENQYV